MHFLIIIKVFNFESSQEYSAVDAPNGSTAWAAALGDESAPPRRGLSRPGKHASTIYAPDATNTESCGAK